MPAQALSRIPAVLRIGAQTLVLAVLLGGVAGLVSLGGCQLSGESEASTDNIAADTPPPNFGSSTVHRYLFTVQRTAPAAEVEEFFRREVIPALSRDPRIGNIATFADERNALYGVQLDLKTDDLPRLSLALDILGIGREPGDAERLLQEAARYIDPGSARELVFRPDLSINRNIMGTIEEGKKR